MISELPHASTPGKRRRARNGGIDGVRGAARFDSLPQRYDYRSWSKWRSFRSLRGDSDEALYR